MATYSIDANLFKRIMISGAFNLKNNHKEIDYLNVFPVPDGDTGTNMQLTMMSGVREFISNKQNENENIVEVSKVFSKGLLMGARGNSGVILSQFFRGMTQEISKEDRQFLTILDFINSLVSGYKMAYRAVMEPVEGTILTVVREAGERLLLEVKNIKTIEEVFEIYLKQLRKTLLKTQEILPQLKEAGVVDSGGAGFIKIVEGMQQALLGNDVEEIEYIELGKDFDIVNKKTLDESDIKFGYCTEFITKLYNETKFKESQIFKPLSQIGDSMVVAVDQGLLKVHVHTNQPGVALTIAQKYGEIQTTKIENMRLQNKHVVEENKQVLAHKMQENSKYAIIVVANGEGIKQTFLDMGVDFVIDGGQTMNPSTQDFIDAINTLNAENIIIIPNNKNIIMAAEQTIELLKDQNIGVIKTKNLSQGYASIMRFDPTCSFDENLDQMNEVLSEVKSGEVTFAVRDTQIKGIEIKQGDYLGIYNSQIITAISDRVKTTKELLRNMIERDTEICTIFYGKDVLFKEAERIKNYVLSLNEDVEVDLIEGKQEVYSYIIEVE